LPQTVEYLQLRNLKIEFTHIFGNLRLPNLVTLDLINEKLRVKEFDENEIKALI